MTAAAPAMRDTDSPPVLPPPIRRHSVRLDVGAACGDLVGELPPELSRAVHARQIQYLAGRYCARRALGAAASAAGAAIGRGPRGTPEWPPGTTGSITHTRDFASAAVATSEVARAIGIDSEGILAPERAEGVAPTILTPGELARAGGDSLPLAVWVTAAFSAKESLYKLLHPLAGVFFGYLAATVVEVDPAAGTFRIRLETTLSADLPAGQTFDGGLVVTASHVHTGLWLPR